MKIFEFEIVLTTWTSLLAQNVILNNQNFQTYTRIMQSRDLLGDIFEETKIQDQESWVLKIMYSTWLLPREQLTLSDAHTYFRHFLVQCTVVYSAMWLSFWYPWSKICYLASKWKSTNFALFENTWILIVSEKFNNWKFLNNFLHKSNKSHSDMFMCKYMDSILLLKIYIQYGSSEECPT